MKPDGVAHLRPLRRDDAADVQVAFASHPDMPRPGDVSTIQDADGYVSHLVAETSTQQPWAIATGDRLVGLVSIVVDATNRNCWFWYGVHAVAPAAGFVREGTKRGKSLIDGVRIDVATCGRLRSDPTPRTMPLEMHEP